MSEVRITHLHPRLLRERRDACPVAWLPLGTLEWHGKHLPLGLDGLAAEQLSLRAASEIGGVAFPPVYYGDHRGIIAEALAAPGVWGGVTFDHRVECCRELGVTVAGMAANGVRDHARISQQSDDRPPAQHSDQYVELLERSYWMIRAYGFTRIVAVPGHGGVFCPAQDAADRFNAKQSTCRAISGQEAYLGDGPPSRHAGAWETATMMYLFPDLVEMDWLASDNPDELTGIVDELWGHPKHATAERGKSTVDGFVARCRALLEEVPPPVPLEDPDEDGTPADWTEWLRSDDGLGSYVRGDATTSDR